MVYYFFHGATTARRSRALSVRAERPAWHHSGWTSWNHVQGRVSQGRSARAPLQRPREGRRLQVHHTGACGVAQVAPERGHGSSLWRARRARWPGCAARGSQPRLWHATARPIIVARAATTPPRRLPPPVASHASSTALTSHVSPLAAHRARLASPAQMKGAVTSLINPETQEEKDFAFDFSYWSHGRFNQPNQPP